MSDEMAKERQEGLALLGADGEPFQKEEETAEESITEFNPEDAPAPPKCRWRIIQHEGIDENGDPWLISEREVYHGEPEEDWIKFWGTAHNLPIPFEAIGIRVMPGMPSVQQVTQPFPMAGIETIDEAWEAFPRLVAEVAVPMACQGLLNKIKQQQGVRQKMQAAAAAQQQMNKPPRKPNEPCYCGSGKKFKKCHAHMWGVGKTV